MQLLEQLHFHKYPIRINCGRLLYVTTKEKRQAVTPAAVPSGTRLFGNTPRVLATVPKPRAAHWGPQTRVRSEETPGLCHP